MSSSEKTWKIEGMHCPHCDDAVLRAVAGLSGLKNARADYRTGTLKAECVPGQPDEAELERRLREAGYGLKRARGIAAAAWRVALAIAVLAGVFYIFAATPVNSWLSAFPIAREGMGLGMLFVIGLLTSLHCTAMCGGICIAQCARAAQSGGKSGNAAILYNLGRVISYTVIGGIVGAVGSVLSLSGAVKAGIQIAAAAFMLLMALNLLGSFGLPSIHLPAGLHARLMGKAKGRSALVIGLLNGFMPCGPLQSMQLVALSTGSVARGALSMLCFSLGTVPLMLGVGWLSGRLNAKFAKPMRLASALLVAVMGISMLTNGLSLAGVGLNAVEYRADGVAVVQGDRQYVRSELEFGGYPAITVEKGVPVVWTIDADASRINGCNNEIVIPAMNMSIPLHPGENVIEFTPGDPETIPYTCWMGMLHGSIRVVDSVEEA